MKQLYTRWGRTLDPSSVLNEYPRPLLIRPDWQSLNGYWEYAFTDLSCAAPPAAYEGRILVPFSPESALSGVGRQLQPDQYLWYRRSFAYIKNTGTAATPVTEQLQATGAMTENGQLLHTAANELAPISRSAGDSAENGRLLLHFGAVDQICTVYVNGREIGSHTGGYLPFTLDITDVLNPEPDEPNELVVRVRDLSDTSYHARGKQKLKRGGMFYTATSGIWQTVWLEWVPAIYITGVDTEADIDRGVVRILVHTNLGRAIWPDAADSRSTDCRTELYTDRKHVFPADPDAAADSDIAKRPALSADSDAAKKPVISADPDVGKRPGLSADSDAAKRPALSAEVRIQPPALYIHEDIPLAASGTAMLTAEVPVDEEVEIPIPDPRLWDCDHPWLYVFTATLLHTAIPGDHVQSYFALRAFTLEQKKEPDGSLLPRICLNHNFVFQKGILDQGYWPDGLLTPPSEEAMLFDLIQMRKTGFNMVRKHIKIEPQRWYYHCDRMGLIVWQDMVNGGGPIRGWYVTYLATLMCWCRIRPGDRSRWLHARQDARGRQEFIDETLETIRILKNHPSICTWVIFNEGWGQFQTRELTDLVRRADPSRLIDQASGWFDQRGGDMCSIHNYFTRLRIWKDPLRANVLSEFGGKTFLIPEHSTESRLYGYGAQKTLGELNEAYEKADREINALIPQGMCASVYTQWTDIEDEVNGIFTYDREVRKIR